MARGLPPMPPIPKLKVLKDPSVPGNTTLGCGINAPRGLGSGILQDPGVPGQVLGAPAQIPTTYQGMPLDPNFQGGSLPGALPNDGGISSGAKTMPNFLDILQADPLYQQAIQTYNTQQQTGYNALGNQIRQAVIGSGWTPDMSNSELQGYGNFLDQATLDAANQNQMSQRAQLDKAYNQQQTGLDYALAARGTGSMGRGGALTAGLGLLKNQYDVAGYQGMQNLLGSLYGNIANYNQNLAYATAQRNQAVSDVANRLASMYGPSYAPVPGATLGSLGGSPVVTQSALQNYLQSIGYKI